MPSPRLQVNRMGREAERERKKGYVQVLVASLVRIYVCLKGYRGDSLPKTSRSNGMICKWEMDCAKPVFVRNHSKRVRAANALENVSSSSMISF